jgi:hypothetical protein
VYFFSIGGPLEEDSEIRKQFMNGQARQERVFYAVRLPASELYACQRLDQVEGLIDRGSEDSNKKEVSGRRTVSPVLKGRQWTTCNVLVMTLRAS